MKKYVIGRILGILILFFLLMAQTVEAGSIKGKVTISGLRSPTVVYLKDVPGDFPPPEDHAVMDQKELTYIPHVLPVLKGTTVDFPNSDTVRHNVFTIPNDAKEFDLGTYPVGTVKQVKFEKAGEVPLLCNVHTEMSAYVVVLDNPYFALTDEEGSYVIKGIPAGKYTVVAYNERYRSVEESVKVDEGNEVTVNLTLKRRK